MCAMHGRKHIHSRKCHSHNNYKSRYTYEFGSYTVTCIQHRAHKHKHTSNTYTCTLCIGHTLCYGSFLFFSNLDFSSLGSYNYMCFRLVAQTHTRTHRTQLVNSLKSSATRNLFYLVIYLFF